MKVQCHGRCTLTVKMVSACVFLWNSVLRGRPQAMSLVVASTLGSLVANFLASLDL
jgi:hypothetical protein